MEAALESLKNIADSGKVQPALKLIKAYFDNISKEPSNPKYRKIRVGNAKFNATIWQLEEARTFLLLAGFEQNGEFLILPGSINIDTAKIMVDGCINGPAVPHQGEGCSGTSSPPSQEAIPNNSTLKLSPFKGTSYFDQEIKANLTLLSYMVEMGFDKSSAEQALIATKNVGIQPAMDWLSSNSHLIQHKGSTSSTCTAVSPGNCSSSMMGLSTSDSKPAPTSRYQKTADERHKFQEKLRLEAIEAARVEKIAKQQHKENLLKEMHSDKEEKRVKYEMSKKSKTLGETSEGLSSTSSSEGREPDETAGSSSQEEQTQLKIRLPDGKITELYLPSDGLVKEIYRHVTRTADISEDDFVILTVYPQTELKDMTMTVQMAGLTPRANLVVQRQDQHGVIIEGHGEVCTVKTITSMDDWQAFSNTKDKLLVVEFFTSWCAKCRNIADKFESLNAEYGINQAVLFTRVDIDQLRVLKYHMHISTLPTFKLYWNEQEIATLEGNNMDELQELIKENYQGPDETQLTDQDPR